jgi:hypothetical protein
MVQEIRKYRDMMGETGAGIMHEEDVDMERDNSLTQSWGTSPHDRNSSVSSDGIDLQLRSKRNAHGSSS